MLRIHQITSATDAKRYYAVADYYAEGQETVGRWGGKLAEWLGLEGTVGKETFDLLCDNRRPDGTPLTLRMHEQRRVGYDFVFSAPKGFSLVEALAPPELRQAMLAAFDAAVEETMAEHVEPDMQTRVRVNGEDCDRKTGSMLWASFDHSTARPVDGSVPDPHRHRHVVCFNATLDPVEGRIKAGQFAGLKRDGEYYTAIFYSKLAAKLEAAGIAVDRRGGKAWGIAGISPAMERVFSKRTGEVEAEHREREESDPSYRPEHKFELGAKTRAGKQKELTQSELRREWDTQLGDADRPALEAVYRQESPPSPEVTPSQTVEFAIAHLSERLSVFPEREMVRVALLHGLGHVSPEQVRAELPRHGVILGEFDGRLMATTRALQAEEDRMVRFARPGCGIAPIGLPEGLERGHLNDGQWQAVVGLLNSPNRVNLIEGPAGAGKSSLLRKFNDGVRLAGGRVTYLATTAKAAEVLEQVGFDAHTLARFLVDRQMQEQARGGRIVIDETSMLGHRDAARLCHLAETLDLTLIAVGDPMQHGSVPRGAFHTLLKTHAGVMPFRLTEIMRQEDDAYRDAAKLLSEGKTLQGFDALNAQGWVREIESDEERYLMLAAEYLEALEKKQSILVVSPTHAEAATITQVIRSSLREVGLIGEQDRMFSRLVPVNATEAERGLATTYRKDDILQFSQNRKGGITKGDRLVVGDPAEVPLEHAGKFSLYRPEAIALAQGDTIRFTGTVSTLDGKHKLRNGSVGVVAGFDRQGNIRLKNGWMVAKDAGHLRHAVVETSYGAQGQTHQKVLLGMASASIGAMNQEQLYVSATRGKTSVSLYTDDKTAIRSAIARSSQKLAALDLMEKKPAKAANAEPWRHHRAHAKRHGFFARLRAAWEASPMSQLHCPRRRPRPVTPPVQHDPIQTRHQERGGHER